MFLFIADGDRDMVTTLLTFTRFEASTSNTRIRAWTNLSSRKIIRSNLFGFHGLSVVITYVHVISEKLMWTIWDGWCIVPPPDSSLRNGSRAEKLNYWKCLRYGSSSYSRNRSSLFWAIADIYVSFGHDRLVCNGSPLRFYIYRATIATLISPYFTWNRKYSHSKIFPFKNNQNFVKAIIRMTWAPQTTMRTRFLVSRSI